MSIVRTLAGFDKKTEQFIQGMGYIDEIVPFVLLRQLADPPDDDLEMLYDYPISPDDVKWLREKYLLPLNPELDWFIESSEEFDEDEELDEEFQEVIDPFDWLMERCASVWRAIKGE